MQTCVKHLLLARILPLHESPLFLQRNWKPTFILDHLFPPREPHSHDNSEALVVDIAENAGELNEENKTTFHPVI